MMSTIIANIQKMFGDKIAIVFLLFLLAGYSSMAPESTDKSGKRQDCALVDYFMKLNDQVPKESPERWLVNKSRGYPYAYYYKILKGDLTWNKCSTEKAREDLVELRKQIIIGQKWPVRQREVFSIPYAKTKPDLDGKTDSPAWKHGLQFKGEYKLNTLTEIPSGIEWSLLWDEQYIYVSAKIPDTNPVSIHYDRPKNKFPWDADCFEVFIMTSLRLKLYWEIVVTPDGQSFDGLHYNKGRFVSCADEDMKGMKLFTKKTAEGYIVQLKIPFKELPNYMSGNKPEPGQVIYMSLLRINDGQRFSARPLLYDGHNIFGYFKAVLVR